MLARRGFFVLVTLTVLSLAAQASGSACQVTTSPAAMTFEPGDPQGATFGSGRAGSTTVYVTSDVCQPGCAFSVWVYAESNMMAGLQRADPYVDDTCGGAYPSDHILA